MRTWRRPLVAATTAALCLALLARPEPASAAPCPAPETAPPLATVDGTARAAFLAAAFDREVRDVDVWSWTWSGVYVAGTIAQGVGLALTHDPGTKVDLTVGVISTGFGAVTLGVLPLQLTLPLRAARARLASASPADACAALAHAEETLVKVESDQALANGILAHAGNVAVNVGIALILGLGYGRWTSAAVSGGVGVAVGEANAFTQPHHLRKVLARYRAGDLGEAPAPAIAWRLVPVVSRELTGARLQVTF